jgi:hypothetical protein
MKMETRPAPAEMSTHQPEHHEKNNTGYVVDGKVCKRQIESAFTWKHEPHCNKHADVRGEAC